MIPTQWLHASSAVCMLIQTSSVPQLTTDRVRSFLPHPRKKIFSFPVVGVYCALQCVVRRRDHPRSCQAWSKNNHMFGGGATRPFNRCSHEHNEWYSSYNPSKAKKSNAAQPIWQPRIWTVVGMKPLCFFSALQMRHVQFDVHNVFMRLVHACLSPHAGRTRSFSAHHAVHTLFLSPFHEDTRLVIPQLSSGNRLPPLLGCCASLPVSSAV